MSAPETPPSRDTPPGPETLSGPEAAAPFARPFAIYAGTALLLTLADLVTKHLAFARVGEREVLEVIPGFLNFIQARNFGAAFSVMWGQIAFFVGVSAFAAAILTWFSYAGRASGASYQVTLGVVASGVFGNLHDRLRFGYVRDFIDVYASNPKLAQWLWDRFGMTHWPTFNVADMCICCGTAVLVVRFWREEQANEAKKKAAAASEAPVAKAGAGTAGEGVAP